MKEPSPSIPIYNVVLPLHRFETYRCTLCRDSQGFCCSCTYSEAVAATFGSSGSTDTTRANLDCDVFTEYSLFNGIAGSASCLRFDPLWYQACPAAASTVTL